MGNVFVTWDLDHALVLCVPALERTNRRFRNKSQTWQDYLLYLGILPRVIFTRYQIVPSTEDESDELVRLLSHYQTLAQWLDFLRPGDKPMDPDLFFTDKLKLKKRAELSTAILDLAIQLQPLREELQLPSLRTPTDIWFAVECDLCEEGILGSGVIVGQGIQASSKEDVLLHCREAEQFLKNVNVNKWPLEGQPLTGSEPLDLALLLTIAALEAKDNPAFRLSTAYQTISARIRKFGYLIRETENLNSSCFENGEKLPSGRKASRSRKGFGN